MDTEFHEKIVSVGHWRINIRPLHVLKEKLLLNDCTDAVRSSSVSLRGWSFPHFNEQRNETSGYANMGDYYLNWTGYSMHWEFWRMYRSGQFLSYKALVEDFGFGNRGMETGRALHTTGAIYSICEFAEFARRLASNLDFQQEAYISVGLRNSKNRSLVVSADRMPFVDNKTLGVSDIHIERSVSASRWQSDAAEVSLGILTELFDNFGWNPRHGQIESDIEKFYSRNF